MNKRPTVSLGAAERLSSLLLLGICVSTASMAQTPAAPSAVPTASIFGPGKSPQAIAAEIKAARAKPTPHAAAGHPDLSGYWSEPGGSGSLFGDIPPPQTGKVISTPLPPPAVVNTLEAKSYAASLADESKRPRYLSAKNTAAARANFLQSFHLDPASGCSPPGITRLGAPTEIVQTAHAVYLLYSLGVRVNVARVVPTDGGPHNFDSDALPNGNSVGTWQGDALVIDTVNIDPDSWVDNDGSIHSKDFHVIERLTRTGDVLTYSVHMEDPIFAAPFDKPAQTLLLGKPSQHLTENYPCIENSEQHMVQSVSRIDDGLSEQDRASLQHAPGAAAPPAPATPKP